MKIAGSSSGGETKNINLGSNDELQYDICDMICSSYKSCTGHTRRSIHARNVEQQKLRESLKDVPKVLSENSDGVEYEDDDLLQKPFALSSTCDKVVYGQTSYQKHMNGLAHEQKMLPPSTLDSLKNGLQDDRQIEDEEFFSRCDFCNKQFSGAVSFMTHLNSREHEHQVKQVQARKKLKYFFLEDTTSGKMICKECKKMFSDPFSLKLHLESNSHKKQKVKEKVLEFVATYPEIVAIKSVENILADDANAEIVDYDQEGYFLVCKLCHTSFSGVENAEDHVLSKKHIRVKNEKKKLKLLKIRMEK